MSEIRNRVVNPYSLRNPIWSLNCTSSVRADGRRTFTPVDASKPWGFAALQGRYTNRFGNVEVAVIEHDAGVDVMPDNLNCVDWVKRGQYSDTVCWIAGALNNRGSLYHELQYSAGRDLSVTLLGAALYTPDDWTLIEKLMASGDLSGPWWAPPRDGTTGQAYPPVLTP